MNNNNAEWLLWWMRHLLPADVLCQNTNSTIDEVSIPNMYSQSIKVTRHKTYKHYNKFQQSADVQVQHSGSTSSLFQFIFRN